MRILNFIIVAFFSTSCFSQISIGVIAEPTLNLVKIGPTPSHESDSLINLKTKDYTLGFGIEIRKQIDRFTAITFIPGYTQSNMLLIKENLDFLDIVHPELPEIRDLAQAATKRAYLHYRYSFVGTQVLYSKKLKVKTSDSKFGIEAGGGLGLYYMIKDDVKVRTEGFAIQTEYIHIIEENTGTEASPLLINAIANLDMNYKITPDFIVVAGIKATAPFTATTKSTPKIRIFTPALRLGFRYLL